MIHTVNQKEAFKRLFTHISVLALFLWRRVCLICVGPAQDSWPRVEGNVSDETLRRCLPWASHWTLGQGLPRLRWLHWTVSWTSHIQPCILCQTKFRWWWWPLYLVLVSTISMSCYYTCSIAKVWRSLSVCLSNSHTCLWLLTVSTASFCATNTVC